MGLSLFFAKLFLKLSWLQIDVGKRESNNPNVDLVRLTSIHTRSNQHLALSIPCHPEVCIDDCADIAGALSVETQSADGFHPLPLSLSLFFSLYISALSISLFLSIYLQSVS
jgi:hypothetical protein